MAELFIADHGVVCVWMDCEFDEAFELPEDAVCDVAPVADGQSLLF